ncbi:hypothetical protein QQ045_009443 [Rhodiola kirilowii]
MASFASAVNIPNPPSRPRLRGVVFDMDGTLTVPVIDFPAMYKAVLGEEEYLALKASNPSGVDILHHIETWTADKQQKAYEVIAEFERHGLDRLQIMPGAFELCSFLDEKKIRRGLITRNVKEAVDLFHTRFGLKFLPALSREFRPYKPDPAPLHFICSAWDVQPNEVIMIGDSLKDDVACGKQAGAYACLLDETGRYNSPEYANVELKPDFTVSSLAQIHSILEANFDLLP